MESFTGIHIIVQRFSYFVYSLLQGNVEKGINFKAPTGKYTQREKEKNFYLDQSRKQDIEYPWKKALLLNFLCLLYINSHLFYITSNSSFLFVDTLHSITRFS